MLNTVAETNLEIARWQHTTNGYGYMIFKKTNGSDTYGYIGDGVSLAQNGTDNDFVIRGESNLLFSITNSEKVRIDSSGHVGFGVSDNLFYKLTLPEGSGDVSRIGWRSASGNRKASIDCGNTDALVFRTGATEDERVRIDSNGNVGIGNTNPINSSGYKTLTIGDGDGNGSQIHMEAPNGNNFQMYHSNTGLHLYEYASEPITFYTNSLTRFVVADDGKVGIGVSSPTRTLDVRGKVCIQTGERIESTDSSGNLLIQGGSTYPGGHIKLYGGSGDDKIEFRTTGASQTETVRMTMDGGGDLIFNSIKRGVINDGDLPC